MWNSKNQQAWDELKQILTSEPVLGYFDINKYLEITVDASPLGLSAVLTLPLPQMAKSFRMLPERCPLWNASIAKHKGIGIGSGVGL